MHWEAHVHVRIELIDQIRMIPMFVFLRLMQSWLGKFITDKMKKHKAPQSAELRNLVVTLGQVLPNYLPFPGLLLMFRPPFLQRKHNQISNYQHLPAFTRLGNKGPAQQSNS